MVDVHRMPTAVSENWDWQLRAACRDLDTAQFFHPDRERGLRREERDAKAKQVCHSCPVIVECRRHALATHEPYGVWGGMTEKERQVALADTTTRTVA
ncbi:MAG TPA: WhiB family transcriptional regulator [Pseudonocardiaceae bacterium]|jgi:WhiB family redox-sensing transcriptional regulator|nr:WhiB family transcriptional regulator [Pseudonocardiaceae bacterium]